jgi:phosphoribosylanthranilate isomerase
MKCKICGTGSFADLKCALAAGADAVGFIVGTRYRTDDAVSPQEAAAMVKMLPPFVSPVAVTHLTDADSLIRIAGGTNCTTLQIQDDILPETITEIYEAVPYLRIVKAVHVTDASAVATAECFAGVCDAILLDTKTADRIGGTGIPHDWQISRKIVECVDVPVILAGGLTPENVAEAVRTVRPYAVDVHSGVKTNGVRDCGKTRAFVELAKKLT